MNNDLLLAANSHLTNSALSLNLKDHAINNQPESISKSSQSYAPPLLLSDLEQT